MPPTIYIGFWKGTSYSLWTVTVQEVLREETKYHYFSAWAPPGHFNAMALEMRTPVNLQSYMRMIGAIRLGTVSDLVSVVKWIDRVGADVPDRDSPGWQRTGNPQRNFPNGGQWDNKFWTSARVLDLVVYDDPHMESLVIDREMIGRKGGFGGASLDGTYSRLEGIATQIQKMYEILSSKPFLEQGIHNIMDYTCE